MAEDDNEKLLKIFALVAQGLQEAANIMRNKQAQKGRTEEQNFDHAEEANRKAKELIDAL